MKFHLKLVCFMLTAAASTTTAFTLTRTFTCHNNNNKLEDSSSVQMQMQMHSRRETFAGLMSTSFALVFGGGVCVLKPDVSSAFDNATDDAITVTKKLASPSALRSVKQVARKLAKLEDLIDENNYEDVRLSIRVLPFTEVRKNSNVIMGGLPMDDTVQLRAAYTSFIQGLESMDNQAGLGQRGRKDVDMRPGYNLALSSLNQFIVEAEKNSDMPVKYEQDVAADSSVAPSE